MTHKLISRLRDIIQKILIFVEKDRTNVVTATLLIIFFSLLRIFFERNFLTEGNIVEGKIFIDSVYNWAHVTAFFTTVFLAGTLIISFFSKHRVRKVANVILWGFWLIIIPPLIDHFVFGLTNPSLYEYVNIIDIIANITTLFSHSTVTWGIKIMVLTILVLLIFYTIISIYHRTRSMKKAVIRTFLILIFTSLFMGVIGSVYSVIIVESFSYDAAKIIYFEMFLSISIFLTAILIDISDKKILPYLLSKFKPYQLAQFVLLGFFGLIVSGKLIFVNGDVLPSNNLPYILLCLLTLAFGWQFTGMISDVYDEEINEAKKKNVSKLPVLTRSQYLHAAIVMAIISFGISILLSPISMLLVIACIFLAFAYSIPPLRLKRNAFAGSIIVGLGSVCAFLIGYFTTDEIFMTGEIPGVVIGNYILVIPYSPPILSLNALIASIIIFFTTFVIYLFKAKYKAKRAKR